MAGLQVVVVTLLAGSVVGAVALYPVALWLVVGLAAGPGLVVHHAGASPVARSRPWCRPACSWPPRPSCRCTPPALTAVALAVALVLTGLVHTSARSVVLAAGAGALLAAALAAEVWTAGHLLDAAPAWVATAGLLALGALVLGAPYLPDRWWVADAPVLVPHRAGGRRRRGRAAAGAGRGAPRARLGDGVVDRGATDRRRRRW